MSDETAPQSETRKAPPQRRRFHWRRWLVGCVLVALFVWLLPSIIAVTPLRNVLLNRIVGDPNWRASAGQMSLGWNTPLVISDLELRARTETSQIEVDSLASENEWWRLLWERPALGSFVVEQPHVNLLLGDALPRPRRPQGNLTLAAAVHDAGLTLHVPGLDDPSVDMAGFDVTMRVERAGERRELVVDPTVLFAHQELTPEMCSRGLHLIAPVLADAAQVDGEFSLQLNELRVPLDVPDGQQLAQAELVGRLQLHRVDIGLRNPILSKVVPLISRVLDVPLPARVRIADESDIRFYLDEGRVHHTGLAFGLPTVSEDLVVRTSGSVGLDESLDLIVEVPLVGEMLGEGPIAKQLAGKKLSVHVAGTTREPRLTLRRGEAILKNFIAGEEGPIDAADLAESAVGIAQHLLEARRERQANAPDESAPAGDADLPGEDEEESPRRGRPIRRLLNRLLEVPAEDDDSTTTGR